MSIFEASAYDDHESVLFINEPAVGLKAIIAIHNTRLGPALGGCRMWQYAGEADAIRDVLRLSRGMTYKAAILDCGLGGGKSVIIGDPAGKTPELFHAMGRAIDQLNERYIVGEDIGTNPLDMREIRRQTRAVVCLGKADGGYGDPAPLTALGVLSAMQAGVERALETDSLDGLHVALQGVGNVGGNLCRLLVEAGARVTVCDVNPDNLNAATAAWDVEVVDCEAIYDVAADVFAPCAMGAILNDDTLPRLRVKVVAGAANNQLDEDRHGEALANRGIVYLPDYVANGGGLINCAAEWFGKPTEEVPDRVRGIRDTCAEILERASVEGIPTNRAADRIAEDRFSGS